MTAIKISEPGGPEVLVPTVIPIPKPKKGEVLVKTAAAGVNRPDIMQRKGNYPPPRGASEIPGLEVSGTIVKISDDVRFWKIGDKVCALVAGGGYAEYCTAPALQCLPIPKSLSMEEAAALPETLFTVWDNVFTRGKLQPEETILIHGGSSGIGTTAIQLASSVGANVITTAGSDEKCKACEKLGASAAINYRKTEFLEAVKKITNQKGVDVILDIVGGDYVARNLRALSKGGRLIQIAVQGGNKAEIPLHLIMTKQITFTGSTLRPRSVEEKALIKEQLHDKAWPLIESGEVKPLIYELFPLKQASNAHALMDSSAHIGKIVLTV
ncbi:MAG: NAD(P)H-quinone oxidoreductase [Pseudomonadota bacterium]|nr:NAD(P)H-quinone oxidoreductase [Pseudomonadota bacterium]